MQRFVDRFSAFLTLVGLTVLVLGGVGVANAVQNYIGARTETIATLKCLGADGALIFRVYFWQVGALAAVGVVVGFIFLLFEGVGFKELRREAEEEEEALES